MVIVKAYHQCLSLHLADGTVMCNISIRKLQPNFNPNIKVISIYHTHASVMLCFLWWWDSYGAFVHIIQGCFNGTGPCDSPRASEAKLKHTAKINLHHTTIKYRKAWTMDIIHEMYYTCPHSQCLGLGASVIPKSSNPVLTTGNLLLVML